MIKLGCLFVLIMLILMLVGVDLMIPCLGLFFALGNGLHTVGMEVTHVF